MPELPDVAVYIERLQAFILSRPLERVRISSPFLLRSVSPQLREVEGRRVIQLRRLGKRIVIGLEEELFLVLHLMIAGRLRWRNKGAKIPSRWGLAAFDFPNGTVMFTEAGSKKRAALFLVQGEQAVMGHDPGGLEVLEADLPSFQQALVEGNHTLKRVLTDPRIFSGIGNAYSDEILHSAGLSPLKRTLQLKTEETERLYHASRAVLLQWIDRLREQVGEGFPEKVTGFRPGMAVHGRYGRPCPVCRSPVQRIVYAENESNYCPRCQTNGRILADRVLSRLLRDDWPRTVDELEDVPE